MLKSLYDNFLSFYDYEQQRQAEQKRISAEIEVERRRKEEAATSPQKPSEEEQIQQKVAEPEKSAPPAMEAETSEEIDSISDEALVCRSELEMEFELDMARGEESSPVEVIEEPMDQQLVIPVHSAPDFANLESLAPDQGEIVDEKCEQMIVESEESSVNLDEMFDKLKTDAEKNKAPKTEEEEERERSMAEINLILEQTYNAIDLCDHRLVDGCDLRKDDFDKDVEENVQVNLHLQVCNFRPDVRNFKSKG